MPFIVRALLEKTPHIEKQCRKLGASSDAFSESHPEMRLHAR